MRRITLLIVHCTATPEGRDYGAKDVDRWHRQRGFNMIGYHYLVRLDGTIERGRPEEMIGAHCTGHNAHSIGVCYVGGMQTLTPALSLTGRGGIEGEKFVPADTRTEAQTEALRRLLKELKERYPRALIVGHNTFARKACPCFDAAKEYIDL